MTPVRAVLVAAVWCGAVGACTPAYEVLGRCIESSVEESPRLFRPCVSTTQDTCRYVLFEDEYDVDVAFTKTCRECLFGFYPQAYVEQVCTPYDR